MWPHAKGTHLPLSVVFSLGSRPSVYSAYIVITLGDCPQLTAFVQRFLIEFDLFHL